MLHCNMFWNSIKNVKMESSMSVYSLKTREINILALIVAGPVNPQILLNYSEILFSIRIKHFSEIKIK